MQNHAGKAFQLPHRSLNPHVGVAHIELDDFLTGHRPTVFHLDVDRQHALGSGHPGPGGQIVVGIGGVAQAKAKRKGRRLPLAVQQPVAVKVAVVDALRIAVKEGQLPGRAGKGTGQFGAGVGGAKQQIGQRMPALHPRIPGHEDGRR